MSYWEIFYNSSIPVWQRIGLAALFPVAAPLALLTGCGEVLPPDNEKGLPERPISPDTYNNDADVYKPDACEPEECEGIKDNGRCISFSDADNLGLASEAGHTGIEIVDMNGDGLDDVYLLNTGSTNQLFINEGGKFIDRSKEFGLNVGGDSRAAAFGDYDGDGDLDLFLAGDSGSRLYTDQNGLFSESDQIEDNDPGRAAVWLGANLFLATDNGTKFYRYSVWGFVEDALTSGLLDPGKGSAFAVADHNGDGLHDVYLANSTGKNRLFQNIGDYNFVSVEDELGVGDAYGNATDAAWVLLEPSDDSSALYVTNWNSANRLYVKSGEKYKNKAVEYELQDPGNTTCSKWGDFVGDGFPPGLFLCRDGQMNLLYMPNIEGDKVKSYTNINFPSKMAEEDTTVDAGWLDLDNDGRIDLVAVAESGAIYVYKNETHWVKGCE